MKVILVTGGSRGIGRATALAAGSRGWSVAINYLDNKQAAEETAAAVTARGGRAITLQGDMAREQDIMNVFDRTQEALGMLDGVVINAGVIAPSMPLAEMSAERMEKIFAVNTLGAYLCARECARRMPLNRGGRGGSVVLLSSTAARLGSPFDYVDYAGSKAAVETLAIGLAKELATEGVRVNAVRPGLIATEIHATGGQPDRAARVGKTMPMGRAGLPEEVAEAIMWLLDDGASFTSGTVLEVAGAR